MRSRARKYRGRTRRGGMFGLCTGASCASVAEEPVVNSIALLRKLKDKLNDAKSILDKMKEDRNAGKRTSKNVREAIQAYEVARDNFNRQKELTDPAAVKQFMTQNNPQNPMARLHATQAIMDRNIGRTTTAEQAELNAELVALEEEENPTPHP